MGNKSISCGDTSLSWCKRKFLSSLLRDSVQNRYLEEWKQCSDQGRATICTSAHPASNHCVTTGNYTSFGEYRFALKARLNLLPTRTSSTTVPATWEWLGNGTTLSWTAPSGQSLSTWVPNKKNNPSQEHQGLPQADLRPSGNLPWSTWCRKLDTTLRGAIKQKLKNCHPIFLSAPGFWGFRRPQC